MNSLIIGDTSQLAHYFPKEYERISSDTIRNNFPLPLRDECYDRVFLCFAEQSIPDETNKDAFTKINHFATTKLAEFFQFLNKCNYVIVYGTCELWNKCEGAIDISTPFNYISTPHILSKERMTNSVRDLNYFSENKNVIILHPFNFNSPYRKSGYLFHKIFDSIINKKKIEIGNTYFYRDLIHPRYVVERSMLATEEEIVGSGRLTFVNDFIRTLYEKNDMKYEDYVSENLSQKFPSTVIENKKIIYLKSNEPKYTNLLEDTLEDIRTWKNLK